MTTTEANKLIRTNRMDTVVSDNVLPRCGHRGTFPITYTSDRGRFAAVVECQRCRAAWVWAER